MIQNVESKQKKQQAERQPTNQPTNRPTAIHRDDLQQKRPSVLPDSLFLLKFQPLAVSFVTGGRYLSTVQ
jgi:hypothetical protein